MRTPYCLVLGSVLIEPSCNRVRSRSNLSCHQLALNPGKTHAQCSRDFSETIALQQRLFFDRAGYFQNSSRF